MRSGLIVVVGLVLINSAWSFYYDNVDPDDAYLLDRLLSQDYQDQRPREYDYVDDVPRPDFQQRDFKFPELSARQKQFAVHPGIREFSNDNLDLLKYRLEELDSPRADADQEILEEELQSVLGNAGEDESSVADKRGLLGGPRYSPLVSDDFQAEEESNDILFTSLIAGVAAASVFAVLGAGFCYHKSVLRSRSGDSVDYPVYGVTGPAKECSPSGDRKLAQSAQMYHYQHQKNQMISVNRGTGAHLEEESEGEQEYEEADYTVYECPGLASTDEMEVKNPLFNDDPTPKNP